MIKKQFNYLYNFILSLKHNILLIKFFLENYFLKAKLVFINFIQNLNQIIINIKRKLVFLVINKRICIKSWHLMMFYKFIY